MTPPEQTKLIDFLRRFRERPELIHEFRQQPDKVVRDSGLTQQHQEVVMSGDVTQIHEALKAEGGVPPEAKCILVVFG